MAIRTEHIRVAVEGSAGTSLGSRTTGVINGRILAVHLLYTSQPATTDVTVASTHTPTRTILTVSNANTNSWFYPRIAVMDTAGVAITFDGTHGLYESIPVDDHITISVAQGDPGNIVATILYEQ